MDNANVKTSMYNETRSYIYNKAFYEAFFNPKDNVESCLKNNKDCERFDLIRNWAATRGLYDKGNSHTQYVKLTRRSWRTC